MNRPYAGSVECHSEPQATCALQGKNLRCCDNAKTIFLLCQRKDSSGKALRMTVSS